MMNPSSSNVSASASTSSRHSLEYIDLPDDNIETESAQSAQPALAGQRQRRALHSLEIELAHGTPIDRPRGFDRSFSDSQMDAPRDRPKPRPLLSRQILSFPRAHEINMASDIHRLGEIEEVPPLIETQPLLATGSSPSHFSIETGIDLAPGTGTSQISLNAPSSKTSLGDRLKSAFLLRRSPPPENKNLYSSILENKPGESIVIAKDPVINALLQYGGFGDPASQHVIQEGDISLAFKFNAKNLLDAHEKLNKAYTIKLPLAEGSKKEKKGNILLTPLLLQVIKYGKKGLGANAILKDEAAGAESIQINEAEDEKSIHIFDYLADLSPEISSNKDHALAEMIQNKVAQDPDLKARLAAASLLQLATKKEFELKTIGFSALSVASSCAIGTAWEFGLAPLVNAAIFGQNFSPTKVAFKLAGINCVPSFVSEFIDTMLIKAIIQTLNKEDWSFKELLPAGAIGGTIAAAGAYFNNVLQYKTTGSKAGDIALNIVTTEAAVLSAASGVPMQVKENEAKMNEALQKALEDGLLDPAPAETAEAYITRLSKQAQEIAPGDSIAQKSIILAGIIGLVPLILSDKITGAISNTALRILNVTLFNPIEVITMAMLNGTSKLSTSKLGLPRTMTLTSDKEKHAQVLKLIFEKAQLNEKNENDIGIEPRDISDKELNDIFHPTLESGFQTAGSKAIDVISFPFIKAGDCIDAIEVKKRIAPLVERLKYCMRRETAI